MTDYSLQFPVTSTDPDALDTSPGDLLAVIELNALQAMAALQVLQCHVSNERAVVKLHHSEALLATGAAAQSSDAIVRDQFAVRQGLSREQQTGLKTLMYWCMQSMSQMQICGWKRLPVLADVDSG